MLRTLFGLSWREVFARLFGLFFDQPQPSTDGKSETVCEICKKTFAYHGGTSNLQAHLERKHPHSFKVKSELQGSVEKSATRQKAQPLITQRAIAKPSATPALNQGRTPSTIWLRTGSSPIYDRWVSSQGRAFCACFPSWSQVTPYHVAFFLLRKYSGDTRWGKVSVKNELAKASGICPSTDIWTSRAAKAYNTATVHFIDGDWSLRTGVLETASFPGSHTGVTHTHTRTRART